MLSIYIPITLAGALGGVIRGLVGFVKHQYSYKDVPFDISYFVSMMIVSAVVGLATAVAVDDAGSNLLGISSLTPGLAFIAGYAGGDFIENLYKIVFKKAPFS